MLASFAFLAHWSRELVSESCSLIDNHIRSPLIGSNSPRTRRRQHNLPHAAKIESRGCLKAPPQFTYWSHQSQCEYLRTSVVVVPGKSSIMLMQMSRIRAVLEVVKTSSGVSGEFRFGRRSGAIPRNSWKPHDQLLVPILIATGAHGI
jgi:hypothetical protein